MISAALVIAIWVLVNIATAIALTPASPPESWNTSGDSPRHHSQRRGH